MQAVETDRKSNKSKSDTNSQRSQGDPADIEDTRLLDDKDNM